MFADIFSSWDYTYALAFSSITSTLFGWASAMLIMFFWLSHFSSFLPTRTEMSMLKIINVFSNQVYEKKENTSTVPATAGLYSALYITLLFFNLSGHLPGFYAISQDFFMALTFSTTVVLAGNLMFFSSQWFNLFPVFMKELIESGLFAIVVTIAELVSTFVRPFVMALRLFLNIMAGQCAISLTYATLQTSVMKLSIGSTAWKLVACAALTTWELGVGIFQATLFVYLCLVYQADGSYNS
nr:ATP synthase F0 subunit 6 [Mytilopsis leucophaeata]